MTEIYFSSSYHFLTLCSEYFIISLRCDTPQDLENVFAIEASLNKNKTSDYVRLSYIRAYLVSSGRRFHRAVCAWHRSVAGPVAADAQTQAMLAARGLPAFLAEDRYPKVICTRHPRGIADAVPAQWHAARGQSDDRRQTTRRDPLELYQYLPLLAGQRGSRNSRNLHGRHARDRSSQTWR